ncbi:hypothetical protein Hte_010424 [Hypoxylon texense]
MSSTAKPRRAPTITIDSMPTEPWNGSLALSLRQKAKIAADTFLANMISKLEIQRDDLRKQRKSIQAVPMTSRAATLKDIIMLHNWHLNKLTAIRKLLEQDEIGVEAIWNMEQAVRDYVAHGKEKETVVAKDWEIYNDLLLGEKEGSDAKDARPGSIFTLPSGRSMGSQISIKSTSLTTEALWAIDDSLKAWIQSIEAQYPKTNSSVSKAIPKIFRKVGMKRKPKHCSSPSEDLSRTSLPDLVKTLDKMRTTVNNQGEFDGHGKGTSKQALRELLVLQDDIKRMFTIKGNWAVEIDPTTIYALEKRLDEWVQRWKTDDTVPST